ncbi:MAG: SDR family NAD(P)-dependent oxidoreductase [Pseudomonadota bacterium]
MELGLTDKIVLITGAGSGIGQALALAFVQEGARVAVNDLTRDRAAETLALIAQAGGTGFEASCDISDLDAVRHVLGKVEQDQGRIDVLVNNAALLATHAPSSRPGPRIATARSRSSFMARCIARASCCRG